MDGGVHQTYVAGVGECFVLKHDKQRREEITHALRVPLPRVSPDVGGDDVAKFREVVGYLEKPNGEVGWVEREGGRKEGGRKGEREEGREGKGKEGEMEERERWRRGRDGREGEEGEGRNSR